MQETWVWFLGWEDPLEKRMATHCSIFAWRIPQTRVWDWWATVRGVTESDTTVRLSTHAHRNGERSMGAGPLSCAVFRATLLLMHNLSQTSAWSATMGFPSAWFAVWLEVCTLDSGWDPLSRLHLDEGQTREREGRSLCLRLWAELPQPLPTLACLPLSSRRQAEPVSGLSASGKKERLPRRPVLRESEEESKLELVP